MGLKFSISCGQVFKWGNSFLTFDDDTEEKLVMWEVRKIVGASLWGHNFYFVTTFLITRGWGKRPEGQPTFRKNLKKLDRVVKGVFWEQNFLKSCVRWKSPMCVCKKRYGRKSIKWTRTLNFKLVLKIRYDGIWPTVPFNCI